MYRLDVILILEDLPEIFENENLILKDVIRLEQELEKIFTDLKPANRVRCPIKAYHNKSLHQPTEQNRE